MEKSTSTATQTAQRPPSVTSSLPAQNPPLPTAAVDQRSSPAMNLDSPPAFIPGASVQGQTLPIPAPAAPSDPSSRGRKRAWERNLQIENSNYYKMRLLVKDLRPHFLEVLRTPDFRSCKAAIEIQEKMKLMLQLYQEMIGETPKRERTTKSESLSNGKAINSTTTTTDGGDKVVGGSAFGWNFVTYGGTEATYCGPSKEEYRTSHPTIQAAEAEVELHKTL